MAGRAIERHVKRLIQEQGGYQRLCDRYGAGETVIAMSRTFLRPDKVAIDRSTLSNIIHRWCRLAPENQAAWDAAERDHADARGERAVEVVAASPIDRDSIAKARAESEANFRYAGLRGRERWGESKQALQITVNTATVHLDALRHRMVEASRPLAAMLAAESSAVDSERSGVGAPETDAECPTDTVSVTAEPRSSAA